MNNQYCCSPGSIHPVTKQQYRVIESGPLAAPSAERDCILEVRVPDGETGSYRYRRQDSEEAHTISNYTELQDVCVTTAWKKRGIYNALVEVCEKRCENLGDDYLKMCRKHAANICKKPAGPPVVIVGGVPAGSGIGTAADMAVGVQLDALLEETRLNKFRRSTSHA